MLGHHIQECKKRLAKEKKKDSNMVVSDALNTHTHDDDATANFVKEEYAFLTSNYGSSENEDDASFDLQL